MTQSSYGQGFARAYDPLMSEVDYNAWAQFYSDLLERAGCPGKSLVDLACGTGNLTLAMSLKGYSLCGVDRSEAMLRIAGEKIRRSGRQIPLICQDMCRLSLHKPVDGMICGCDGINYLLDEISLRRFFLGVSQWLKPGGVLALDFSTEYKLSQVLGNHLLGRSDKEIAYLWQNQYDEKKRICRMELSVFSRRMDGTYDRDDEQHIQRAHRPQEVRDAMESAGLRCVGIWDNLRFEAPHEHSMRVFMACKKG